MIVVLLELSRIWAEPWFETNVEIKIVFFMTSTLTMTSVYKKV